VGSLSTRARLGALPGAAGLPAAATPGSPAHQA